MVIRSCEIIVPGRSRHKECGTPGGVTKREVGSAVLWIGVGAANSDQRSLQAEQARERAGRL